MFPGIFGCFLLLCGSIGMVQPGQILVCGKHAYFFGSESLQPCLEGLLVVYDEYVKYIISLSLHI